MFQAYLFCFGCLFWITSSILWFMSYKRYNQSLEIIKDISIVKFENQVKDFSTPFIESIYSVDGLNNNCDAKDRVLHYPWFGAYPTCVNVGEGYISKRTCKHPEDNKYGCDEDRCRISFKNYPGFPMI